VEGKTAILVDDGLATGYTVIAAVRAVRKRGPGSGIVAAPVSPRRRWDGEADELIVLYVSDEHPFAVASFYEEWTEMTDEEVRGCLRARGMGERVWAGDARYDS
jgi:putative phosphoribosyl transferase